MTRMWDASSAVHAGDRLGHYELLKLLGSGGMGEVYRARDSRLNRDVAIKVLPGAFAQDHERVARFRREAQLLAALNHPNVAGIYGLEESGSTVAIALELVEGEDLAERMTRGALPVPEALAIAKQIAEGLEAAHERGIVHRDLKPANIKISKDGVVKILDFGLAKAFTDDADAASDEARLSATMTRHVTEPGMILGTTAYMAPEQARGTSVDKRADIWAFGVVLFEMLTGRRLFDGGTVSDMLAAVLTREIDLAALPPSTPGRLRALIARCLVRDPRQRLRDIGDARLQIDEALLARDEPLPVAVQAPAARARWRWGLWLAIPAIALAAAAAGWYARPVTAPPLTRLSIALPPGQIVTTIPAISRDGRVVAYAAGATVATSQLYVRTLDSFAARPVAGSGGARYPFFSPDGRMVAFFAEGKLRRATVAAPVASDIARAPEAWGGTWGVDGHIIYVPSFPTGLWRVPAEGGVPEQLTKPDGAEAGYAHMFPHHLPGTDEVLFGFWGKTFYTALYSTATGKWREVTQPQARQGTFVGTYAASGHVLAGDSSTGIRAAAWNPAMATAVTPETPVLDGVYWGLAIERPFLNVSESGTVVYVPGDPSSRRLVWVDRQGRVTQVPGDADQILRATVSRDGRRVAYDVNRSAQWVVDLATSARTRITSDVRSWHGGWLPGDTRLVVASNKGGDWDLYTVGTSGSGELTPLLARPFFQFPQAVAPDGTVVFMEDSPVTGTDLWTLPPGGQPSPLVATPFNETGASVSMDGRFVAYVSEESGRPEIYAIPLATKAPRVAVSLEGGTGPVWSRDGRELFYRSGDDLVSVEVKTSDAIVLGARRKLLDLSGYESGFFQEFDASADGQRFLLIRADPASRPTRIDVIVNWFGELTRLVGSRP